jgi:hypothetical protein
MSTSVFRGRTRSRCAVRALLSATIAGVAMVSVGSRAAVAVAPVWSPQSAANPGGPNLSFLIGVSCSSPSVCEAVGYYDVGIHTVAYAERWNGSSWSAQTMPAPTGAGTVIPFAVSCVSGACEAAGYYEDSSAVYHPLAERWNGTSWRLQTIKAPGGAGDTGLGAISCRAANACEAAGYFFTRSKEVPLAEAWNGSSWRVQMVPVPTGARPSAFDGISCPASNACEAVGSYRSSAGVFPLQEGWNGTAWKLQATPGPSGGTLEAVSCASAIRCEAVGFVRSATPLIERWNGTSWATQAAAFPPGRAVLYGVSCSAADACEAVGDQLHGNSPYLSFSEHWTGSTWESQSVPAPTGLVQPSLSSVSCPLAIYCEAVGYAYNGSTADLPLADAYS